jgi:uncharacterized membrane protein
MTTFLKSYLVAVPVFFAIDMLWLGLIANNLYRKGIGFIMKDSPNWSAAIVFYLLYLAGMVFFVIQPSLEKQSWKYALFVGMFFGFITYATYDLTNLATLKNWPVHITLIDLLWGTFLGGSVSVITHFIASKF